MAKDIHDKYIEPPSTTDFAILFLPFENIYAEVIRRTSLIEILQREYKIIVTGPTTLEIEENPNTLFLFLVADNRLATATVSGPMLGNRAYFTLDKKQNLPKRSMISIVKSTPAGFEEIYNTYQTEAYKMLYNGMIVIVRDGVMYDLMGTRIK